jgi:outer membrane lipoprotein SlyB
MNTSYDRLTASLAAMSLACIVVLVLGGCGPQAGDAVVEVPAGKIPAKVAAAPVPSAPVVQSFHLGEVRHIETLTERPKGTGVGAVAGGVLGGVVGHQVGDGNGQKAATAVGAVGGALLGNKIERDRAEKVTGYRVEVRLDNGDVRSFERAEIDGLRVGSRVRVDGSSMTPA